MDVVTGSPKNSWKPEITADTTTRAYWLNWRVALCAIWISSCIFVAAFVVWKYEGTRKSKASNGENDPDSVGTLYEDEAWKPCLKEIHPGWLLAYRVLAFVLLLALLIVNVLVDTGTIFYFYTQWTFTLVTIYFGLGSLLSIYGCYQHRNEISGSQKHLDTERGMQSTRRHQENGNSSNLDKIQEEQFHVRKTAGIWTYMFQIIFQMNAGAVMLTDFVFWFIIVPFLTLKDYNLNLLLVGMHSVNAVFLFGDTALNSLRFPWFRAAYFVIWTSVFVIFQWVVHACVSIWWPYPFLDLSSSYAPLWYFLVGFMHIPCYAIFALVVKMKHYLWSRWFPQSYQCRS